MKSRWGIIALLLLIWAVVIYVVNPVGEFTINDDFAFTKALNTLRTDGIVGPTWMGPQGSGGGPALFTHLLWGLLFSEVFGYSITVLRLSVLTLAIGGSLAFFFLLNSTKAGDWVSFWGTLTLMFNPLYFSQSFTYMTDITFVSLLIFSFLLLHRGIDKNQAVVVAVGLIFGLFATLTRQFGVIGSLAFMLTCLIHPKGRRFGRSKAVVMTILLTILPWLAFERFLYWTGSTPITQHELVHELLTFPIEKGFLDYLVFVFGQFCLTVFGYAAFLVSPLVALLYKDYFHKSALKYFFIIVTALFVAIEVAICAGFFTPPQFIRGNIVFNFGIGPILLKDVYILGIKRMASLPTGLYYIFVWWSVLSLGLALPIVYKSVRQLFRMIVKSFENTDMSFLSCLTLLFIMIYGGTISAVWARDRYLIPLSAMLIVFLFSYSEVLKTYRFSIKESALAVVPLIFMTIFSVGGTHDFMALKRSQTMALDYLTKDLKVDPHNLDGGMEFNGYNCYRGDYESRNGTSWWWVDREDFVVTLGDLDGFETVKKFPFRRLLGMDGAIHILKPRVTQTP
jgi:4-amino-4-deoxy-L-arabinose transferase-like glycosyltransferase